MNDETFRHLAIGSNRAVDTVVARVGILECNPWLVSEICSVFQSPDRPLRYLDILSLSKFCPATYSLYSQSKQAVTRTLTNSFFVTGIETPGTPPGMHSDIAYFFPELYPKFETHATGEELKDLFVRMRAGMAARTRELEQTAGATELSFLGTWMTPLSVALIIPLFAFGAVWIEFDHTRQSLRSPPEVKGEPPVRSRLGGLLVCSSLTIAWTAHVLHVVHLERFQPLMVSHRIVYLRLPYVTLTLILVSTITLTMVSLAQTISARHSLREW